MRDFLGELKRRNVFRVAVIYVITAWVILQVADVLFGVLQLPQWTLTFVAALLLLGFPMALIFSWAFEITSEGLKRSHEVDPDESITPATGRKLNYLIIGGLSVVVVILLVRQGAIEPQPEPPGDDPASAEQPSVAVLPFVNMSEDPSTTYFSDGIAEELLNALMRIPDLDVVGRTSSFAYRDQNLDLREIGRKLDATHILEGSVRRAEDEVRITAQLVKTSDGYHVWSETYSARLDDIFEVQEQIGRAIAEALQLELLPETLDYLARPSTDSFEAYDFYLQGQAQLRTASSPEDYEAAIGRFEQALRRDPVFAAAEAGKCRAQFGKYWELRDAELLTEAIRTCDRAATRDPDQPQVQIALGTLYHGTGQNDLAIEAFDKALRLEPDSNEAHRGLADALIAAGQNEAAFGHYERAIEIAPHEARNYGNYAVALFQAGRLEESIPLLHEAIRLDPSRTRYYSNLGGMLIYLGRFEEAAEVFRKVVEIEPTPTGFGNAGTNYYYAGDFKAAAEMYRRAVELAPEDFRWRGNLADACHQATSGCETPAREHYRKALEQAGQHLAINPEDAVAEGLRGLYHARLGETERARERLRRALQLDSDSIEVTVAEAVTRAILDDLDGARAAVQRAIENGYPVAPLRADPDLSGLFTEPVDRGG